MVRKRKAKELNLDVSEDGKTRDLRRIGSRMSPPGDGVLYQPLERPPGVKRPHASDFASHIHNPSPFGHTYICMFSYKSYSPLSPLDVTKEKQRYEFITS
jgi:hypothetical protein